MNKYNDIIINKDNILIVVLTKNVRLLILENCPKTFSIDNIEYSDPYNSDWTGFYDWQRDKKRNVIGITHFTFEDYQYFLSDIKTSLADSPNILVREGPSLDIYFSDSPKYVEDTSGDQMFGDNRIYKSELGQYAISFNMQCLTETELKSLNNYKLEKYINP